MFILQQLMKMSEHSIRSLNPRPASVTANADTATNSANEQPGEGGEDMNAVITLLFFAICILVCWIREKQPH